LECEEGGDDDASGDEGDLDECAEGVAERETGEEAEAEFEDGGAVAVNEAIGGVGLVFGVDRLRRVGGRVGGGKARGEA